MRATRRAEGLACIAGTAVCWIASSYISQALVRPGPSGAPPKLPPLLLCYICTSQFVVYLPIVYGARGLRAWWRRRRGRGGEKGSDHGSDSGSLESSPAAGAGGSADARLLIHTEARGGGGVEFADSTGGDGLSAPLLPSPETGGAQGWPAGLPQHTLVKAALMVAPAWFLAQLAFAWSLALTSVTSNTILSSTSCLFAFLASILFTGEKFTPGKALSVAAVMAGTAAVALADSGGGSGGDGARGPGASGVALGPLLGDGLATCAAALYAVYTILIQRALGPAGAGDTALLFGHLGALTAAGLLPALALLQLAGAIDVRAVAPASLGLAAFNGLMDYVLADFLWARAVLLLGPTIATLGLGIQIPMAATLDVFLGRPAWLRGGRAAALTLGGSALVLGGFVWITVAGAPPVNGGGGGGGSLHSGAGGHRGPADSQRAGSDGSGGSDPAAQAGEPARQPGPGGAG